MNFKARTCKAVAFVLIGTKASKRNKAVELAVMEEVVVVAAEMAVVMTIAVMEVVTDIIVPALVLLPVVDALLLAHPLVLQIVRLDFSQGLLVLEPKLCFALRKHPQA